MTVGAAILIAAVSSRWFALLNWHDSQRLLQCGLLSLVAIAAILQSGLRQRLLAQATRIGAVPMLCCAGAIALGVASAAGSGLARFGLLEVALALLLLLFAFCAMSAHTCTPERFSDAAIGAITAAAAVLIVLFLSSYSAALFADAGFEAANLYRGGFSNPRFLAQVHTLALPVLGIACVWPAFALRWRVLCYFVLVLTWVMAWLTASRATWYALAAACLVLLLLGAPLARRLIAIQLGAIAASIGAFYAMFWLIPKWLLGQDFLRLFGASLERLGDPMSLSLRDELWTRALELIQAHPLLGVGPMGLALDFNPVAAHPHSAPLQIAAEWGLPALVLMAVAVSITAVRCAVALRAPLEASATDNRTLLPVALACSMIGAAVHSLVDGVIVMPVTQTLLAMMAGWTVGVLLPPSAGQAIRPRYSALCITVIAAALFSLLRGIAPEAGRIDERQFDFARAHPGQAPTVTRFWTQGRLIDEVDPAHARFSARRPAQ